MSSRHNNGGDMSCWKQLLQRKGYHYERCLCIIVAEPEQRSATRDVVVIKDDRRKMCRGGSKTGIDQLSSFLCKAWIGASDGDVSSPN